MATTTNYGWTTPDDTALVKDGASAIRSLGTSVDTTTKNLNPSTTLGDIEYRSSTANTNTRLGIGSTGQVLTVAGGVPTWAAPAGGGKVLQVVNATTTTTKSTTTSTYVDSNLTATITPTSATSKILVFVSQNGCYKSAASATNGVAIRLFRNSTALNDLGYWVGSTNTAIQNSVGGVSATFLDSPATTSATTYKTQIAASNNTATVAVQYEGENSYITLMEIGA